VVIVVVTVISFITVREKTKEIRIEKASFSENVKVVLRNRPFLILTSGTLMHLIAMNIMAIVVNYYFKYNLNAEPLIPIAFLSLFITAALSLPIFVKLSKKRSKKFAYNVGMGIVAVVMMLIFFFGHEKVQIGGVGIPLIFVFLVLAGVGLSTNWLSPWSMIPDTVEYSEWKTGLRREGILYGLFYFVFKAGTALAGFLVGSILAFTGYVANIEQTERALFGIRSVMTVVPTVLLILGIIIISFYPIDAAAHKKMLDDIAEKKA